MNNVLKEPSFFYKAKRSFISACCGMGVMASGVVIVAGLAIFMIVGGVVSLASAALDRLSE